MPAPLSAAEVLNREFLETRCKILELAAALDRLDRAAGSVADDARLERIHEGLRVLHEAGGDRAEQVQLVFSRHYDPDWQGDFRIAELVRVPVDPK